MKTQLLLLQKILFVFLILGAPLSKYPSISTPLFDFSSFRIGLYQVAMAVFVLLTAPMIVRDAIKRRLSKRDELIFGLSGMLMTIALLGLGKAENLSRSFLMVASFGLLLMLMLSGYYFVKSQAVVKERLLRYTMYAGIGYGVISVIQLLVGTFTSPENSLLCTGCASDVFGFPRVSGLAAEPLFWANALIPFFVVSYLQYRKYKTKLAGWALFATSLAICLTFARGAYLAIGAIVIAHILHVAYAKEKHVLKGTGLMVVGLIAGFSMLVASASIRYSEATAITYNTVAGMIDHLSLGVVSPELHIVDDNMPTSALVPDIAPSPPIGSEPEPSEDSFVSEGLVEASGDDRIGAAKISLNAWRRPSNTLFGVGLGNLGPYVVKNIDPLQPSNLTVYIFYVLFLVEMGVVGLVILLALFGMAVYRQIGEKDIHGLMVALILLGFLVQYVFFGSYINVGYIWLWLGIGLGLKSSMR